MNRILCLQEEIAYALKITRGKTKIQTKSIYRLRMKLFFRGKKILETVFFIFVQPWVPGYHQSDIPETLCLMLIY